MFARQTLIGLCLLVFVIFAQHHQTQQQQDDDQVDVDGEHRGGNKISNAKSGDGASTEEHPDVFHLGDHWDARELFFCVLAIVALTIVIELFMHWLEHFLESKNPVFSKIKDKVVTELFILGLISFIIFFLEQTLELSKHSYFIELEFAHMLLFFVGISYAVQSLYYLWCVRVFCIRLDRSTNITIPELKRKLQNIQNIQKSHKINLSLLLHHPFQFFHNILKRFKNFFCWLDLIDHKILKNVESGFRDEHYLPESFDFSRYLSVALANAFVSHVDLPVKAWVAELVLLGVGTGLERISGASQNQHTRLVYFWMPFGFVFLIVFASLWITLRISIGRMLTHRTCILGVKNAPVLWHQTETFTQDLERLHQSINTEIMLHGLKLETNQNSTKQRTPSFLFNPTTTTTPTTTNNNNNNDNHNHNHHNNELNRFKHPALSLYNLQRKHNHNSNKHNNHNHNHNHNHHHSNHHNNHHHNHNSSKENFPSKHGHVTTGPRLSLVENLIGLQIENNKKNKNSNNNNSMDGNKGDHSKGGNVQAVVVDSGTFLAGNESEMMALKITAAENSSFDANNGNQNAGKLPKKTIVEDSLNVDLEEQAVSTPTETTTTKNNNYNKKNNYETDNNSYQKTTSFKTAEDSRFDSSRDDDGVAQELAKRKFVPRGRSMVHVWDISQIMVVPIWIIEFIFSVALLANSIYFGWYFCMTAWEPQLSTGEKILVFLPSSLNILIFIPLVLRDFEFVRSCMYVDIDAVLHVVEYMTELQITKRLILDCLHVTDLDDEANIEMRRMKLQQMYEMMGGDNGKGIDEKDLRRILSEFGIYRSKAQVRRLMRLLDLDRNGRITFEEFTRVLFRCGEGLSEQSDEMECSKIVKSIITQK